MPILKNIGFWKQFIVFTISLYIYNPDPLIHKFFLVRHHQYDYPLGAKTFELLHNTLHCNKDIF